MLGTGVEGVVAVQRRLGWVAAGVVVGAVVGLIAAVNVVIFAGIDGGYEAGLGDVFSQQPITGVIVVLLWFGGPLAGALIANRATRAAG